MQPTLWIAQRVDGALKGRLGPVLEAYSFMAHGQAVDPEVRDIVEDKPGEPWSKRHIRCSALAAHFDLGWAPILQRSITYRDGGDTQVDLSMVEGIMGNQATGKIVLVEITTAQQFPLSMVATIPARPRLGDLIGSIGELSIFAHELLDDFEFLPTGNRTVFKGSFGLIT